MEEGDNIQVCIRVRPPVERELASNYRKALSVDIIEQAIVLHSAEQKTFSYDYVADESTTQEQVFHAIGKPICESCMQGYNGTIFAYGQTGSGKTFTMQGPSFAPDSTQRGLIPRMFEYLFALMAREERLAGGSKQFLCKASYLEIYNEHIYDLLDAAPAATGLNLREDIKKGPFVEGLIERMVASPSEAQAILSEGAANRTVGSTAMNRESSRSHSVFVLTIQSKETVNGICNIRHARLNLVDLAGSERQKLTEAAGERLKEASLINKSLSTLGNVIMSLVDIQKGKSRHIAYRDSKLTFLLKDSLGGNTKTAIVANISPCEMSFGETLSTLKFAQRAKMIRNAAVINEDVDGNVVQLQDEIARLKDMVSELRRTGGGGSGAGSAGCGPPVSISLVDKDGKPLPQSEQVMQLQLIIAEHIEAKRRVLDDSKRLQRRIDGLSKLVDKQALTNQELKLIIRLRDERLARQATLAPAPAPAPAPEAAELHAEIASLRALVEHNPRLMTLAVENLDLRDLVSQYEGSRVGAEHDESRKAIVKLHGYIQSLEHQMEQLIHEKEALSKRAAELESKSAAAAAAAAESGAHSAAAVQSSSSAALEQWRMSMAFQEQLGALKAELADSQRAARARAEASETRIIELEAELAGERASASELGAALAATKLAHDVQIGAMRDALAANGPAGAAGAADSAELCRLREENAVLAERVRELSKAVTQTETKNARLSLSYSRKLSIDGEELATLRETADSLRDQLAEAAARNADLAAAQAELGGRAEAAEAAASAAAAALASYKADTSERLAALEQEALAASTARMASDEALEERTRAYEALRDMQDTQEAELGFMRDQLASTQNMLRSSAELAAAQARELKAAQAKSAEAESEVAAVRAQALASADDAVKPLMQANEALLARLAAAEAAEASAREASAVSAREVDSLRNMVDSFKADAAAVALHSDAMTRALQEARTAAQTSEADKANALAQLAAAQASLELFESRLDAAASAAEGAAAEAAAARAQAETDRLASDKQTAELLAALTDQAAELKAARAATAAAVEAGEVRAAQLSDTQASLQEALMAEMAAREAASEALSAAQSELASLRASSTAERAELEGAGESARAELAAALKALAAAREAEASLEARLAAARSAMEAGHSEAALVAERLAEAEAVHEVAVRALREELAGAQTSVQALASALSASEAREAEAQASVVRQTAELAMQKQRVEAFAAMQSSWEAARAKKNDELEAMRARLGAAEAAVAEVERLGDELNSAARARAALEDALAIAEEEQDEVRQALQTQINDMQAERAELETKMGAVNAKSQADRQMVADLKKRLATAIADGEKVFAELKDMREFEARSFQETCAYKAQVEHLREEKARMQEEMTSLTAKIDSLNEDVNKLTGHHNLKQKIHHVMAVKSENNNLKDELAAANDELSHLRTVQKKQFKEILALRQALGKENVSALELDASSTSAANSSTVDESALAAAAAEEHRKREELLNKQLQQNDMLTERMHAELAKMAALVAEKDHELVSREREVRHLREEASFYKMRNESKQLLHDGEDEDADGSSFALGV